MRVQLLAPVRRHLRWYEVLPEVVVALGLGIFFVTETDAATSALKSGRALVIMVVVTAGWLVARVGAAAFVRWPVARLIVFGVAAAVVLNVVVLPAYRDKTVVETLAASAP